MPLPNPLPLSGHFFIDCWDMTRVVGKIDFSRSVNQPRYYATVGQSVHGAFCTLPTTSGARAINAGRQLALELYHSQHAIDGVA